MAEYRVNLDIYNGPLDLLLYLIRREEVDIYDIPVAEITEQYVRYVEMIKQLDPNLAGDFLVLAATLLEIKTRMLLPSSQGGEGDQDSVQIDPRAELVRQLLEYKAFKDAADDLRQAARSQALKLPRPGRPTEPDEKTELDLADAQIWDLFDAFSRVMESIGRDQASRQIVYDDTPVELYAMDVLDLLRRDGAMTFARIFAGRTSRIEIVGLFLALLELIRQKKILAGQDRNFGDIHIRLNPSPPGEDEASDESGQLASREQQQADKPTPPPDDSGQYVSDAPQPDERGDDDDEERTQPTGS